MARCTFRLFYCYKWVFWMCWNLLDLNGFTCFLFSYARWGKHGWRFSRCLKPMENLIHNCVLLDFNSFFQNLSRLFRVSKVEFCVLFYNVVFWVYMEVGYCVGAPVQQSINCRHAWASLLSVVFIQTWIYVWWMIDWQF